MTAADQALTSSSELPLSLRGPAPTHVVVSYGFWLFLLSDIVIFAALFAAYAVLSDSTAGGPTGVNLFDKGRVMLETACLLASSFTCGLGSLAVAREEKSGTFVWMGMTCLLGFMFLSIEFNEFVGMAMANNGPTRSAFLSAFFALVGTHGLHVAAGMFWLVVMMTQIATLGYRPMVLRRMFCFGLFWHALDIVWIGVFTIVYLGAR